jgi:hypothetical protein
MSYEAARERIQRCKTPANGSDSPNADLLSALNELTVALETDLVQIKKALSHVALLLESRDDA